VTKEEAKKGTTVQKIMGTKKVVILIVVGALLGGFGLNYLPKFINSAGASSQEVSKTEVSNKRETKHDNSGAEKAQPGSTKLDSFIVNLANPEYHRYLKVTITLYYTNEFVGEEIEQKNYQIRDVVIGVLRSKTENDLSTSAKIEQLRKELVEVLNEVLERGNIKGLYFEEFIIQ
jgi:flagellar basal body-associated protein FliL